MLVSVTVACAAALLLVCPVAAQVRIDPDVIFNPMNPVEIVLDRDDYTRVRVRQETNVKLDCSFIRNLFIQNRGITNSSGRVSVQWFLKRENPDFMSLEEMTVQVMNMNPEQILIIGQFMDVLNVTAIQLPTLAVDGVTGEYTCLVCDNQGMPRVCVNSTIPIEGEPFPPDIDEGDPDGTCPINPLFRFAQCKVGTNYCIPMSNFPSTYMFECLHKPPPAPATPTPQQAIWFLNGVQITTNTGARNADTPSTVNVNPVNKQLTIINTAGNAVRGNYTCVLTNIAGSDVATSIISDCAPPVIRPGRMDSSSQIQVGLSPHCLTTSQLTITCEIESGTTPIMLSWTRDGNVLINVTSDRIVVTAPGTYVCRAMNRIGNANATSQVVVGARISFSGSISGRSDNGCGRLTMQSPRNPDICVFVGENLQFVCAPAPGGDSEASAPVIMSPRGMIISSPVNNVQVTADGVFNCSSSTVNCGTTSRAIDVQVFDPPVINTMVTLPTTPGTMTSGAGRQNVAAAQGDNVRLYCPATGIPPATISWTRQAGGVFVPVTTNVMMGNVGGIPTLILTLNNLQQADFTQYRCTASNIAGTTNRDVRVNSVGARPIIDKVTPPIGPPTGPDEGNRVTIGDSSCIPVGQSVTINCNTIQGSTPLAYQWSRDGVPISNPTPENMLMVTMRGTYRCTVSNNIGSDNASSVIEVTPQVNFQVTSSDVINCDRLTPVPVGVDRCPRFATVEFQCSVNTGGATQITYNGSPLANSVIDPFMSSNDGTYECSSMNSCGRSNQTLRVTAFQPATVDTGVPLPPSTPDLVTGGAGRGNVDVSIGGNVSLYCPTNGVNLPTTMWQRNGITIADDPPRITVTSETVNGVLSLILTIRNVTLSELGTYTCVTMNSDGTDRQEVTVREPPRNEWCTTTWSQCSPDCHQGTRTRTVSCKDNARRILPDTSCTGPKPVSIERCHTRGPCFLNPVWAPQPWSPCTRTCGSGHRIRRVQCVIPRTGTVVDDGQCASIVRPKVFELCNTEPCCTADLFPTLCRSLVAGTRLCENESYKRVCCWTCR